MWQWWQHAFAIESAERFEPTAVERRLVEQVAAELARRSLTLPALVLLESARPLNGLGASALLFVEPWFAAITDAAGIRVLARLVERPGGVDFLVDELQRTSAGRTSELVAASPGAVEEQLP